jgi:thymidylate synthase (FAD)
MKITILQHTPKPEILIAKCASTCYDSMPKELKAARKMIKALIKSGHESCIEHATVTFELDEISRVVTHELVRHRLASYSQRSQRYVNENKPQYIMPEEIKGNPFAEGCFLKAMDAAWKYYKELQDMGFKNEIARYVLPNACSTKICFTANFRTLRNFLKLRCSKRAQPEIREMAHEMLNKLIKIAPSCFEDLKNEENLQNT